MAEKKDKTTIEVDPSIKAFAEVWAKVGQHTEPSWDKMIGLVIHSIGGWDHISSTWTAKDRQWHSTEFIREYERIAGLIKAGHNPEKKRTSQETIASAQAVSALERAQTEIHDKTAKRKSNNETMRKLDLNNIINS